MEQGAWQEIEQLYSFSIYIPIKGINIIVYRNVYSQNLAFFPWDIQ